MTTWTVERIEKLCIEYCARCGVEFKSYVTINGRLKTTLGRCFCTHTSEGLVGGHIEISRQLLKTATEQSILDVIAHECAHYVTAEITHEKHGHDKVFKYYCHMIGTSNDTTVFHKLETTASYDEMYKYTIYCAKCGDFIGGRHRACKVTKSPEICRSTCCNASIKVYQNW